MRDTLTFLQAKSLARIQSLLKTGVLRRSDLLASAMPPGLRMGGAFLQLVATVIIARTLGEQNSGEFFFWSAMLLSLGQIATFGQDRIALQQIPRLSRPQIDSYLGSIRGVTLVFSLLIGLLLIGYAWIFQREANHSGFWFPLLPVCLCGVALSRINGEAARGLGRPVFGVLYRQVLAAFVFVSVLLLARQRLTADNTLLCYTIAFLVSGFCACWGPGLREIKPAFLRPSKVDFQKTLKTGFPIFISGLCTSLNYLVPLILIERLSSSESVSYLTTTYRLFLLFELLSSAIHSIRLPNISRESYAGNWSGVQKLYRATVGQGAVLLSLPIILAFVFADPVMSLFGEGFVAASPILRIFLVGSLISLFAGPATDLVLMLDDTPKLARFSLYKLSFTVVVSIIVIPRFGASGAAVVLGISVLLEKALCLWHYRTKVNRLTHQPDFPKYD